MGGYQPKTSKNTRSGATAGPSADDRFGPGLVGKDMRSRILAVSVVDDRTRVVMSMGKMHGVHVGMEGYIRGPAGVLSELQVDAVEMGRCHAYVEVTPDALAQGGYVMLNPTSIPRHLITRDVTARIIAVAVQQEGTRITIARGFAHGVGTGMRGYLVVGSDGKEGDEFTITGTTARQSFAVIRNTPDYVHQHQNVIFRPPSQAAAARAPVQRRANGDASAADLQSTAHAGVAGAGNRLPHFETIQRAFGKHDISGVRAQVGGAATEATAALGAEAYATGDKVAFASAPDLHTAAHEAAHTIQQRKGAVEFQGLGAADDEHEHHADAVADAVVAGRSAETLLDGLGQGSAGDSSFRAIQRWPKGRAKGSANSGAVATSSGVEIAKSEANEHLKEGEDAALHLSTAKTDADAVYSVVIELAKVTKTHQDVKTAYEEKKKARGEMLAKSAFVEVLTAITTLVEFGVAMYTVIGAAKKALDAARDLRHAYTSYHEAKTLPPIPGMDVIEHAKKDLGKSGKGAGEQALNLGQTGRTAYETGAKLGPRGEQAPDPETMLSDANADAITAGNSALRALAQAELKHDLVLVSKEYQHGALHLRQMVQGVSLLTEENKVMPAESIARFAALIAECEHAQKRAHDALKKLDAGWRAYAAGGAEALSDDRERTLFEKVQAWKSSGDRKARSLRVAMDQATKQIKFYGVGVHVDHVSANRVIKTRYHAWNEVPIQQERGTLYVTDANVANELVAAGLLVRDTPSAANTQPRQPGIAESIADGFGGEKFKISVSMCKALISMGDVVSAIQDASIGLWTGSTEVARISGRQRGDWYDRDWMVTPEFAAFWRSNLDTAVAFVGPDHKDAAPRQIGAATPTDVARSRETEMVGFASPRKRE